MEGEEREGWGWGVGGDGGREEWGGGGLGRVLLIKTIILPLMKLGDLSQGLSTINFNKLSTFSKVLKVLK